MQFLVLLSALVACAAGVPADTTDPKREGRVSGGVEAIEGEFPYMLSFRRNGTHRCGAVIFGDNWALTAAHCVYGRPTDQMTVVAGVIDRREDKNSIKVQMSIPHRSYNNESYSDDIALLKLEKNFTFDKNIKAITACETPEQTSIVAVFSGWGETNRYPTLKGMPYMLRKIDLDVTVRNGNRRAAVPFKLSSKSALSYGDSGGPLVISKVPCLLGIACSIGIHYDLTYYTSIHEYGVWINGIKEKYK